MAGFDARGMSGRPIRIEDVAREAGVSPITVSRTLSNPDKVRAETRERVNAAILKTGYQVNPYASSLRSGRSPIVVMFVAQIENPHIAAAVRGCGDVFANSGLHLIIAQSVTLDGVAPDTVQSVANLRPAAVVFSTIVTDPMTREILEAAEMPVMELWDLGADAVDMLVGFSGADGGRMMAEHLMEQGFRNIAYIGRTSGRGALRLDGFRQGLAPHGLEPALVVGLDGGGSMEDGAAAYRKIAADHPEIDALFFSSDVPALGASFAAERMRRDGHEPIAMASLGGRDVAEMLPTPMTTIQVSGYEVGSQAARQLLRRMRGEVGPGQVTSVPLTLHVRESTTRRG